MDTKTSANPLQVDFIQTPLGGAIGLTHCPGRRSLDAAGKQWDRDLAQDIKTLKDQDISAVVSLLAQQELQHHGAGNIETLLSQAEIDWHQFPISDFGTPSAEVIQRWAETLPRLLQQLQRWRPCRSPGMKRRYGSNDLMTPSWVLGFGST
jgi:protein-tyrosine phosphatase